MAFPALRIPSSRKAVFTVLLALCPAFVSAGIQLCPGGQVTVAGTDAAEVARTCRAAEDGIAWLERCNVRLSRPIHIDLRTALEPPCLGLYRCGEDHLELLAPSALPRLRRPDSPLRHVPDDEFFDSLVVHELVHAAFDTVPCPPGSCIAASEYVAYTMQIMSLREDRIAIFETGFDMEEKVSRDAISALILFMNPDVFQRRAWAHLNQRPDACAYIGEIMAGRVRMDYERP